MSNQAVGPIYQRIITDVVDTSQVDFEESGVPRSTLDELRELWQQKLSSLMVATFPWDPPQVASTSVSGTTISGINASSSGGGGVNGKQGKQQSQSQSQQSQHHQQQSAHVASQSTAGTSFTSTEGGVRIKTEPDTDLSNMGRPSSGITSMRVPPANATVATQRAMSLIHEKFGSQADESIEAMQSGQGQQDKIKVEPGTTTTSTSGKNGVNNNIGQTDGAGDIMTPTEDQDLEEWKLIRNMSRLSSNNNNPEERMRCDDLIRRHVEERGLALEGGGLMLPLREHHPRRRGGQNKNKSIHGGMAVSYRKPSSSTNINHLYPTAAIGTEMGFQQTDGASDGPSVDNNKIKNEPTDNSDDDNEIPKDEDEEKDPDAIDSGLDDESDGDEDGDEEELSQIMLCMYDKVQRTKNKWKCVLKDGVLTVGGREYVFQKASGEFEW
ncbi:MAG: Nucleolar Complex 2 protein [Watsoniomyces obsoletus]|nr:MAG: Nucleolar Complex 2 protein [Watsoniomyces obsoletus]